MALLPVRRLPVTLVLALATAGVLGAALASPGPDRWSFQLPVPHLGDVVEYDVMEGSVPLNDTATFAWTPGGPLRTPDGRDVVTDHLQYGGSKDLHVLMVMEAGTTRLLGMALASSGPFDHNSTLWGPVGLRQRGDARASWLTPVDADFGDCWMGRTRAQHVVFPGTLELPVCVGITLPGEPGPWKAAGVEQVGGLPAIRHVSPHGSEAWLSPALPYPVKVVDHDGHKTMTYTLAGFRRGEAPRPVVPAQPAPPRPAMAFVEPVPGSGLIADDVQGHAFPLRDALAAAQADAEVAAFLSSHPGAVMAGAWYDEGTGVLAHRSWWLTWATPGETLEVSVVRRDPAQGSSLEGLLMLPGRHAVTAWLRDGGYEGEPPAAAARSSELLAFGQWQYAVAAGQGNCYGYGPAALSGMNLSQTVWFAGVCRTDTQPLGPEATPDPSAMGPGLRVASDVRIVETDAAGNITALRLGGLAANLSLWPTPVPPLEASERPAPPEDGLAVVRGHWSFGLGTAAGAGAAAILAGLLYWLWPTLKSGAAGLFTRVRRDNPRRQSVLAAVRAQPGIHLSAIQRATGLGTGSLVHHLRHLEATAQVERVAANGLACYVPAGARPAERLAAGTLRSDGARRVLEAVRTGPGRSLQELALATGLGRATVHAHVHRLGASGMVRLERDGRAVKVHPGPAGTGADPGAR